MELANFYFPRDLWVKFLLPVPYHLLRNLGKVCKFTKAICNSSLFWYMKACQDLKTNKLDLKNFLVKPRLRYVRELGLSRIFYPGFEVYFSPFEIGVAAAKTKDVELLDYIVELLLRENTITRLDQFVLDITRLGYPNHAYNLILKYNVKLHSLENFFLADFEEVKINQILEIQKGLINKREASELDRHIPLYKSIIRGDYNINEIRDFHWSSYYYIAKKYKRVDLPKNPLPYLFNEFNYSDLNEQFVLGNISISEIFSLHKDQRLRILYFIDSNTPLFSFLIDTIQEIRDTNMNSWLFTVKCYHDLNGWRLLVAKIPKELRLPKDRIRVDCPLAKILYDEMI